MMVFEGANAMNSPNTCIYILLIYYYEERNKTFAIVGKSWIKAVFELLVVVREENLELLYI